MKKQTYKITYIKGIGRASEIVMADTLEAAVQLFYLEYGPGIEMTEVVKWEQVLCE